MLNVCVNPLHHQVPDDELIYKIENSDSILLITDKDRVKPETE